MNVLEVGTELKIKKHGVEFSFPISFNLVSRVC